MIITNLKFRSIPVVIDESEVGGWVTFLTADPKTVFASTVRCSTKEDWTSLNNLFDRTPIHIGFKEIEKIKASRDVAEFIAAMQNERLVAGDSDGSKD